MGTTESYKDFVVLSPNLYEIIKYVFEPLVKCFFIRPQPKKLGAYRVGVSVRPSVIAFLYGLEHLNGRSWKLGYRLK